MTLTYTHKPSSYFSNFTHAFKPHNTTNFRVILPVSFSRFKIRKWATSFKTSYQSDMNQERARYNSKRPDVQIIIFCARQLMLCTFPDKSYCAFNVLNLLSRMVFDYSAFLRFNYLQDNLAWNSLRTPSLSKGNSYPT